MRLLTLTLMIMAVAPSYGTNVAPWTEGELFTVPKVEEVTPDPSPGIKAFFYEGISWKGKPTKVLAYYGQPEGKPPLGGWPAVVCVHGGGGTVHPEWVRTWNAHGYAALAMDLEGHLADAHTTFEGSGPTRDWPGPKEEAAERFYRTTEPLRDLWFYQAIAQIARANSLLRTFPDVNPNKIGLAGLSWGGILSSVTVGIDDRYKFAVIFYGYGYLHEGDSYMRDIFSVKGDPKNPVPFEPSRFLPNAKVPILWVNGTNDFHFPADVWQRSASVTQGSRTMRLTTDMGHGPDWSWTTREVFAFADDVIKGANLLPKLGPPETKNGRATVPLLNNIAIKEATLEYTTDPAPYATKKWETLSATVDAQQIISAPLPADTIGWAIVVTDEQGNRISSDYFKMAATPAQ